MLGGTSMEYSKKVKARPSIVFVYLLYKNLPHLLYSTSGPYGTLRLLYE